MKRDPHGDHQRDICRRWWHDALHDQRDDRREGEAEAREDTVLFPALRDIVSKQEFGALGEDFEKKEHQLFGEGGFEKIVERVATIERALGIYDLAQFTPRA
jgi:hypothetical protein